MKISISESAYNDIYSAQQFYEWQAEGLGKYFQNSMFTDIDALHFYAGIHSKHYGYFRALSNRFPYAIYYKIERKTVAILAVLDCRSNPDWIKMKIKYSDELTEFTKRQKRILMEKLAKYNVK